MPAAPRNDAEARNWILSNFPEYAAFLNDAELNRILMEAAYLNEDPTITGARIKQTSWYRQRSAAQRQWDTRASVDPQTNDAIVKQNEAKLRDLASQMGLQLGPAELHSMAEQWARHGFSDEQMNDMLAMHITGDTAKQTGSVQMTFQYAKELASSYYVNITDDVALQFARQVASGQMAEEAMTGWFKERAKETWAYLAPSIDAGITVAQYFDQHRTKIADLLEVAPDSVDLFKDPKWNRITRTWDDAGQERAMTINETERYVRNQDEWKSTNNAKASATTMVGMLGEIFGSVEW